eukprot:5624254-Lingulodinium_polyedra.AAC.1
MARRSARAGCVGVAGRARPLRPAAASSRASSRASARSLTGARRASPPRPTSVCRRSSWPSARFWRLRARA